MVKYLVVHWSVGYSPVLVTFDVLREVHLNFDEPFDTSDVDDLWLPIDRVATASDLKRYKVVDAEWFHDN
jgi:hypothetical protein